MRPTSGADGTGSGRKLHLKAERHIVHEDISMRRRVLRRRRVSQP
jgi:hypothetical protein